MRQDAERLPEARAIVRPALGRDQVAQRLLGEVGPAEKRLENSQVEEQRRHRGAGELDRFHAPAEQRPALVELPLLQVLDRQVVESAGERSVIGSLFESADREVHFTLRLVAPAEGREEPAARGAHLWHEIAAPLSDSPVARLIEAHERELRLLAFDREHPIDIVGQRVLGFARDLPQPRDDQLRLVEALCPHKRQREGCARVDARGLGVETALELVDRRRGSGKIGERLRLRFDRAELGDPALGAPGDERCSGGDRDRAGNGDRRAMAAEETAGAVADAAAAGLDRSAVEEAPEVIGERAGVAVAFGRGLAQGPEADRVEIAPRFAARQRARQQSSARRIHFRCLACCRRRRLRIGLEHCPLERQRGALHGGERPPAGEQLVEDRTQ